MNDYDFHADLPIYANLNLQIRFQFSLTQSKSPEPDPTAPLFNRSADQGGHTRKDGNTAKQGRSAFGDFVKKAYRNLKTKASKNENDLSE